MKSKCKVIAVVNQKGGVGKTTTTYNLGYELGRLGKKVLLVDFDSQGNLTMLGGIADPDKLDKTVTNLLLDSINQYEITDPMDNLIIKKEMVDILPANIDLANLDLTLVNVTSRESVLTDVLVPFKIKYDYILIDCGPLLGLRSINALTASDSIIIPVSTQIWAIKGLKALMKTFFLVRRKINRRLKIEGVLKTMCNQGYIDNEDMEQAIEEAFSEKINIFTAKIPESTKMRESATFALSARELSELRKHTSNPLEGVVQGYADLAKEIVMKEENRNE